jgi:hypothetical protein
MPFGRNKNGRNEEVPVTLEDIVKPVTPLPRGFGNRTPEQAEAALGAARYARAQRSDLMKDIRARKVTLEDILTGSYSDNPVARKIQVRTLLPALPGIGRAHANRIVAKLRIAEGRRVGGLGVHQRAALLAWYAQNKPAEGEE